MSRVVMLFAFAGMVALDLLGHAAVAFGLLVSACAAITGFTGWHLTSPVRERAHLSHRQRVTRRPRPASEWQPAPEPPPAFERPVRTDIVPNPGRRMHALLDDEQEVTR